jgi:ABC-type spermidine/putrescine transport system permease subunit II
MFEKILDEVLETALYAIKKEQVELTLRGVVSGSFVAIFIAPIVVKGIAVVLLLTTLWLKKANSQRKERL